MNLRGVIHGCHAAYPLMLRQGHGQILNVASSAGLIPSLGQMAPYAATKFGVVGLSRALRTAGADHGIRVTALCPGWIDTPLLDGAWPEDLPIPPSVATSPPIRETLVKGGVRIYPADRLAEDTLRGLERNKAVLVIPSEMHRTWLLFRLVPGLVESKVVAMTRAGRKTVGQARPHAVPSSRCRQPPWSIEPTAGMTRGHHVAGFSSQGPTDVDFRVRPEVVALGGERALQHPRRRMGVLLRSFDGRTAPQAPRARPSTPCCSRGC